MRNFIILTIFILLVAAIASAIPVGVTSQPTGAAKTVVGSGNDAFPYTFPFDL